MKYRSVQWHHLSAEVSKNGSILYKGEPVRAHKVGKQGLQYWAVRLDGHTVYVHCLLLCAFVGDRPKGFVADHINGISLDNRLKNLRWCSRRDNLFNGYRHGHFSGARPKLTVQQIKYAKAQKRLGRKVKDLAEEFGISQYTLYDALNGRTWGLRIKQHKKALQ